MTPLWQAPFKFCSSEKIFKVNKFTILGKHYSGKNWFDHLQIHQTLSALVSSKRSPKRTSGAWRCFIKESSRNIRQNKEIFHARVLQHKLTQWRKYSTFRGKNITVAVVEKETFLISLLLCFKDIVVVLFVFKNMADKLGGDQKLSLWLLILQ